MLFPDWTQADTQLSLSPPKLYLSLSLTLSLSLSHTHTHTHTHTDMVAIVFLTQHTHSHCCTLPPPPFSCSLSADTLSPSRPDYVSPSSALHGPGQPRPLGVTQPPEVPSTSSLPSVVGVLPSDHAGTSWPDAFGLSSHL